MSNNKVVKNMPFVAQGMNGRDITLRKAVRVSLLLQLALVAIFVSTQMLAQVAGPPSLLMPDDQTVPQPDNDQTVKRSRNVLVNLQVLQNPDTQTVLVPLFDGDQVLLVRDSQTPTPKGFIWHGHDTKDPGTLATFSVVNRVLIGSLTTVRGGVYQIRYSGQGVHTLRQIDPSLFPPEAESLVHPPPQRNPDTGDTCSTDSPADIDAMIVYTATSRAAAGGQDAMEATINLAVENTNTAYINSNITQRLRLVHMEEVSFLESGDFLTDVNRLQNGSDGFVDNVQPLRDTYAADVVGMIVEESAFCGRSYDIMNPVSNAFESSAYSIINRGCAADNLSLAHEFGHLMGARHDWYVDPTLNSPYAYNHGFANTSPTSPTAPWRTVMAYNNACIDAGTSCLRVPYFSNPNVNFPPGDPMGVATGPQQADNHQVLNNTALTVANFRCSSPSAPNVWMKDTWDDTGAEPDSHTVGEDMWKSPYIWIRNTQDATLVHQHEHQNPVFGATNWVYVKLHNGGTAPADGHLELYWAHAATGLSWPADWNLLTSIPVSAFAAHSTKIVEFQWDGLPGVGHYCMIARWVSPSDPMTFPETSDINYNVRQNNNLVWRNLNIVDLGGDASTTATFIVRNGEKGAPMTLTIAPPNTELNNSFLRYGMVTANFDSTLMRAWQQGGTQGKGFKIGDKQILISDPSGAAFENIMLPPKVTGIVTLTFTRLPTTPKRIFHLDAVQFPLAKAPSGTPVPPSALATGGVSYDITTEIPKK